MYLAFDMANWSWPQWVYFSFTCFGLVIVIFLHGNRRTGVHSAPSTWLVTIITLGVLTAGGFFA